MRARSGGLFHDDHYVREHELRGELTVWVGTFFFLIPNCRCAVHQFAWRKLMPSTQDKNGPFRYTEKLTLSPSNSCN